MPNFCTSAFTMVKIKCNGCNRYFNNTQGLSNHFQHNKECKAIHLNVIHQYPILPIETSQVESDNKTNILTEHTLLENHQECELNQLNKNVCNMVQENTNDDNNNDSIQFASMPIEVEETPEPHNFFMYTNEVRVENNLLKLVSDMNVINDGFKKIIEWAKDAFSTGYQFNPKTTKYKSQIKQMEKFSNLKPIRPFNKPVLLPNNMDNLSDTSVHQVVCCNFTSMLFPLLQDKNLNKLENLVVNEDEYFSKYISPNGTLGEVNSGSWYEQAYKTMVKDPNKDFLLPIIFAMDKTTISSTARMSVYAVMFTTTLFDYKTRNKAHAWQPLGYIPIEKNSNSSAQWKRMGKIL